MLGSASEDPGSIPGSSTLNLTLVSDSIAQGPVAPTGGAMRRLSPVPFGDVSITGGIWLARQLTNRKVAIPAGRDQLERAGNLENLRIAKLLTGRPRGPVFLDSDLYKWLEAVAWEYGREPSGELLRAQREVTALIAGAQQPDGYLNSFLRGRWGRERYRDLSRSHEIYCAGHLIQAAVAQARCTDDKALLEVAVRLANHLVETFGADRRHAIDGHPVIEMALVELFRQTGELCYLEQAKYFLEARGHGLLQGHGEDPTYFSDRVPVRDQTSVEGHAVRAVYLAAGATDVAMELGDEELLEALQTQFADMWASKTYLTGGLGSRWDLEAFGDPYELPSDRAYAETCAAIGGVQWAWRMLLATGEPFYADAAERMLYNGFLAGVSITGSEYFYVNPLQMRSGAHADHDRSAAHGRRGWFECACCPPNVMRTLASVGGYLATTDDQGLQLHAYAPSRLTANAGGGECRISVETDYPWDGRVRVQVEQSSPREWTLSMRVPAWAAGATLAVNGTEDAVPPGAYASVRRVWTVGDVVELMMPMPVRLTVADARVDAVRGCVAVERGPLVYAVEQVDQSAGVLVDDLSVDPSQRATAEFRPDLLGGVVAVRLQGEAVEHFQDESPYQARDPSVARLGRPVEVTAVPYFAWANRGVGPMRVWLPALPSGG